MSDLPPGPGKTEGCPYEWGKKSPALSARRSALLPCAQLCQPSMEPALNPCLKTLDSKLHDGFATQVTTGCFLFGRFSPTT